MTQQITPERALELAERHSMIAERDRCSIGTVIDGGRAEWDAVYAALFQFHDDTAAILRWAAEVMNARTAAVIVSHGADNHIRQTCFVENGPLECGTALIIKPNPPATGEK